jgi:hypothetical protein
MPTSASVQFDDSLWPLLVIRYAGSPTDAQFDEYLAQRTQYLERGERHAVIMDARQASGTGPAERRYRQAAWLKQHDAALREQVVGTAFVTESALVRLMMSVVLHIKPLASPHVAVTRFPEAVAWTADRLHQAGLEAEAHRVRTHYGLLPGKRSA